MTTACMAWHGPAIQSCAHFLIAVVQQSTELKVEMVALHEKRVRKCLSKVKGKQNQSPSGIERVEVEASLQKVVVTGCVNRSKILKALRRVGLRAEPWSPHNELLCAYATTSLMINNSYTFF
ncbi:hypothetical protein HU200_041356 [Digitaria exilis]|uniref:Uncharacterized protein n=1 Tax=Digitaria exilis TaxID=1010633 RepID=A0A835B7U5_9POAL|nr:hypothetical protein HU200_041356 [Digitaria exilis]